MTSKSDGKSDENLNRLKNSENRQIESDVMLFWRDYTEKVTILANTLYLKIRLKCNRI